MWCIAMGPVFNNIKNIKWCNILAHKKNPEATFYIYIQHNKLIDATFFDYRCETFYYITPDDIKVP